MTDNESLYREIIGAISDGNEERVGALLADDLVDHNPIPNQSPGAQGFLEWMRYARQSFPDLTGTVEDVLIDGDRVAARVTWRGKHGGTFLGVDSTDRPVSFDVIHIVRFSGGRAAEWWGVADLLGALRMIGASIAAPGERFSQPKAVD